MLQTEKTKRTSSNGMFSYDVWLQKACTRCTTVRGEPNFSCCVMRPFDQREMDQNRPVSNSTQREGQGNDRSFAASVTKGKMTSAHCCQPWPDLFDSHSLIDTALTDLSGGAACAVSKRQACDNFLVS